MEYKEVKEEVNTIKKSIIFKWECGWGVSDIAEQVNLDYAIVYSIIMEHIENMNK